MQEEKKLEGSISNSEVADNSAKMIFEDPVLCSQLLRDYTGLELLKNIRPEDIEDVTERFIPMFTEQRDADVIKQVHLSGKNREDVFIALIEHKSGVDYNVIMQILRYMVYIWEDYEKRQEKEHPGITKTKGFKYPPILPIVYYEGKEKWSAVDNLKDRVALNGVFEKYIPGFRYLLISLNKYGKEYFINKKDELSLVMLINSIKSAEEFKGLNLPEGYISELLANSPDDVLSVLARVLAVVLRKQNVSEDEIQKPVDQIKERKHMGLFDDWEGFDVQEERRIGAKRGKKEVLIQQVCKKLRKQKDCKTIADELEADISEIKEIVDIAEKYKPEYDVEKILEELLAKDMETV